MFGKREVIGLLDDRGIDYEIVEHEAVYTMEGMEELGLPFGEEVVKNLFVRDDKKRSYYLVTMPEDRPCNMKALRRALSSRPLRFASEEDLSAILGLFPGAVTPFGILNDEERKVTFVIERSLFAQKAVGIHPNDNTATLRVSLEDVIDIVSDHGNEVVTVDLDAEEETKESAQG